MIGPTCLRTVAMGTSSLLLFFSACAMPMAPAKAPPTPAVDPTTPEYAAIEIPKDVDERARDLMNEPVELVPINDFVFMARGIGNVFLIKTDEGNIIYDTGVTWQSEQQRDLLLAVGHEKTTHIIVSHAHGDHNGGLEAWKAALDEDAELITHERYAYTNKIFGDTDEYLWRVRTGTLYPSHSRDQVDTFRSIPPTRTVDVDEDLFFEVGGIRFQVIAAENSAEGEDALLLFLPDQEIVFTGDFYGCLYPMVPNLYTVRGEKTRDPIGYVNALDRLIALEPGMILPAHFDPVEGKSYLHKSLTVMRDGVQYVYDETVAGMNAGKSVWELMETIELPEDLQISQGHGKVSWNVRAIWELLAGWFYYEDVADLYAVPAKAIYPDLVDLLGGPDPIVARAQSAYDDGRSLEALRLLDVAKASGPETHPALALRLTIMKEMLTASETGFDNMSETGILRAVVKQTAAALEGNRLESAGQ